MCEEKNEFDQRQKKEKESRQKRFEGEWAKI